MNVTTTVHINTRGNARELLNFYAKAFDGEVIAATYTDIHAVEEPSQADQVAWDRLLRRQLPPLSVLFPSWTHDVVHHAVRGRGRLVTGCRVVAEAKTARILTVLGS